jgi:hypothetical protein
MRVALPIVITAGLIGWAVWGHVARIRAEAVGADFVEKVHDAQLAFHTSTGGFASHLDSLTARCPAGGGPWLDGATVERLEQAGYRVTLRSRQGARTVGSDCRERALVDDYYVGVAPNDARRAALRAYGSNGTGRVFVFVDGIAPLEADMAPGGLAIPLEEMPTFRIP